MDEKTCSICGKTFSSKKGVGIHRRVHKVDNSDIKTKEEPKIEVKPSREKIYIEMWRDQFEQINANYKTCIQNKINSRLRAREKKGIINGYVQDNNEPLDLKVFIVKTELIEQENKITK